MDYCQVPGSYIFGLLLPGLTMNLKELYDARVRVAESLGFRAVIEQDLEQILSRQDSRDAVVFC